MTYSPPEIVPLSDYKVRVVLDNATTTGPVVKWGGGKGCLFVAASAWNFAAVRLQYRSNSSHEWLDVGGSAFVEDGSETVDVPEGEVRGEIVGSPTSVNAKLVRC